MRSTFSLLPYINRSKVKADGTTAILCRITIDGKQTAISTGIYCRPEEWNSKKNEIKSVRENNRLREYLRLTEEAYNEILKSQGVVSAEILKNHISLNNIHPTTLLQMGEWERERLKKHSEEIDSTSSYRSSMYYQKYLTDFLTSREGGTIEVRCINKDGNASLLTVRGFIAQDKNTGYHYFIGSSRDITREKLQEEFLEERAQKDPLTGVYNRFFGKELIDEYLASRNPYAGCGMMVLDVDYFKNVNDTYGHMFGDEVLKRFAELFVALFDINDVIMRLGGDEFVILLKDISHAAKGRKTDTGSAET